ncbi:MAG: response regulator [Oscillospiraceae bacterium]|jgi:signal transduction histidine kinase/CheY-like chemotaxis protein|nr:response regulator [Oscillospiraceae bacterium]
MKTNSTNGDDRYLNRKVFIRPNTIKISHPEAVLLFVAFVIISVVSCVSISASLSKSLAENIHDTLQMSSKLIESVISDKEFILSETVSAAEKILENGGDITDISDIVIGNTYNIIENGGAADGFVLLYAVVDGVYTNGKNQTISENYFPESNRWYNSAVAAKGDTVVTYTLTSQRIDRQFVTFSRAFYTEGGRLSGVVGVDVELHKLLSHFNSTKLGSNGYFVIVDERLDVISHTDFALIGQNLEYISPTLLAAVKNAENSKFTTQRTTNFQNTSVSIGALKLANGWFVLEVVPTAPYYRGIRTIASTLISFALILTCAFSFLIIRMSAERTRAKKESSWKTSLLIRTSSEIRAPMNSIIEMSELALREKTSLTVSEYLGEIKAAGSSLFASINDILDFSNVESGTLNIIEEKYQLSLLIGDLVGVTRARIAKRPIRFIVSVSPDIPSKLIGDETRVRHIVTNMLGNAVNHTTEGFIKLTVSHEPMKNDKLKLIFTVEDSGTGIRREDLPLLFGGFTSENRRRNVALGLPIARSLCLAMGGDIYANSVFGEGSTFTAMVQQTAVSDKKVAEVTDREKKNVLLFDTEDADAESLIHALDSLGVVSLRAASEDKFLSELTSGEYSHAFFRSSVAKNLLERVGSPRPRTKLVELVDTFKSAAEFQQVVLPVYAVSVASVLNDTAPRERVSLSDVTFEAPSARVLVVDDIASNLKIADRMLQPYRIDVRTCISGKEAVDAVRTTKFDLVLMDHMMPVMDGIQTTTEIRSLSGSRYKNLPIILLTANNAADMRDKYAAAGFNDCLEKPLESYSLNKTLEKWLPKEKRIKRVKPRLKAKRELVPSIAGMDVSKGITLTGGTERDYITVLKLFVQDVERDVSFLRAYNTDGDLKGFEVAVCGLQSAAAGIGATSVGERLPLLRRAAKNSDRSYILKNRALYTAELSAMADTVRAAIAEIEKEWQSGADIKPRIDTLKHLKVALKSNDMRLTDKLMSELEAQKFDAETSAQIEKIAEAVLISENETAVQLVDELCYEAETQTESKSGE